MTARTGETDMSNVGTVFPPRDKWDVAGYPIDDVVDGYREHTISDPVPGDNRPPGYRWGFLNRRRDAQLSDDGYDHIRRAYFLLARNAA